MRKYNRFSKTGFRQNKLRRMSYTKVMLHFIWATKNRQAIISKELKPQGIYIDSLNCVEDHIHLLVSLGSEQTISKTGMLIKGESSFWVNQQEIIKHKFEWQDDYIALSVSESAISKVTQYIANQEDHHRIKTFAQEYETFLTAHGFGASNFG